MAVNLHTTHYRFGINELAESTHGWHAAEDANPAQGVIAVDTTFLLRFTVQETGGTAAGNTDQQFQCALNGGAFQDITTTSTIVKAVTTAVFANGADLTKRLSGTGTFESSGDGGTHDGLSGGAQNDIAASGNSETECALQIVSANVSNNDVVTFRLTSPDFTITNDVVPTLTVSESVPVVVTPSTLTLTTATFAPSVAVSNHQRVTPGVASLTTATFAPTVTASDHQEVTPGVASLSLSSFAPTVTATSGTVVTPGAASLSLAFFAPSVAVSDHQVVTPEAAALSLAVFAPTVVLSDHKLVTPEAAALALTSFAPVVTASAHVTVTPSIGNLNLTSFAPTVTGGAGLTLTPGTASLALTGFAPDIVLSDNQLVVPGTAELTLTGLDPAVGLGPMIVVPGTGALSLTGLAPTVLVGDPGYLVPNPATLALTTYSPTITLAFRGIRGSIRSLGATSGSIGDATDGIHASLVDNP